MRDGSADESFSRCNAHFLLGQVDEDEDEDGEEKYLIR